MKIKSQIAKIAAVFASILAVGVAGLMTIEGWPFLDALYMSVITVSTVGFREVRDLSPAGMVFMIVFIIMGVGSFLYIISAIAEFVIEGHLKGAIGRKKMRNRIEGLTGHYIICGFGRVGRLVAEELQRNGAGFVVIDNDQAALARCAESGYPYVEGAASDDDVLKAAGVMRAKGLVSAIDSDAENVYVTLSAKALKDDIYVVARASSDEAEKKLLKARADRVLSPYTLGGRRLAGLLLHPNVVEFLDVVIHGRGAEISMEEIEVRDSSRLAGLTVGEARQRCASGANILAIRRNGDSNVVASPESRVVISKGDLLIALGTKEQLKELEDLA